MISEDVAAAMNSLLSSVMTNGTGSRVMTADRRPQAGKTGTIDSNAAVWFVGYTPQVAGAAMISIDNRRRPFDSAEVRISAPAGSRTTSVPSTGRLLEGSGSGDAGQEIWKPAMEQYLTELAPEGFAPPPYELVYGDQPTDDDWDDDDDDGTTTDDDDFQQYGGRR